MRTNCGNKMRWGSPLRLHIDAELNLRFGNEDIKLVFPSISGSSHVTDIFLLRFNPPSFASCRSLFKTKAVIPRWYSKHITTTVTRLTRIPKIAGSNPNCTFGDIRFPSQKKARARCPKQTTTLVLHLLSVYFTRYWLDVPGIETRWGRYFPHPPRPALSLL